MRQLTFAAATALIVLAGPVPAVAQADGAEGSRFVMGFARLFSNDAIGDGRDRWRSGSYMVSMFRGRGWEGRLTQPPGDILEYRLRSEIVAPSTLSRPPAWDRRYAGILSLGLHNHFAFGPLDARVGADLVFTGPQTGVGAFQREFHEAFDYPRPRVLGTQIPNGLHATLSAELGRDFAMGQAVTLRPFVEAQAGIEDFARAGVDLTLGQGFAGALMTRDPVTGQRVQGVAGPDAEGFTFTFGADVARVFDSEILPKGGAAPLEQTRSRLRAGVHWRNDRSEVFYGLTWHGREFTTQPDEQVTGSLRLRLRF